MNKKFNRKSIRIREYDYSQEGMYFVTICTKNRENLLSIVGADASVRPSKIGEIVRQSVYNTEEIYNGVIIINSVIMPNHIHLIIYIGRTEASAPTKNNTRNKISCI